MRFFQLRLLAMLLLGITLISVGSTYFDVLAHKHQLRTDLEKKTEWFVTGLEPQLEAQFVTGSQAVTAPQSVTGAKSVKGPKSVTVPKPVAEPRNDWPKVLEHLRQSPDQPSLVVFDQAGVLLASAGDVVPAKNLAAMVGSVLAKNKEERAFVRVLDGGSQAAEGTSPVSVPGAGSDSPTRLWYEDVIPLHDGDRTVGALATMADADYIRVEGIEVWRRSFLRIAATVVLVALVTLLMIRWLIKKPVARAAEWLRQLRHGEVRVEEGENEFGYLTPLAKEVTTLAELLSRARLVAETEARLRDRAENVWTADRLAVHVRECLGDGKLLVVSNREPYMHVKVGREAQCIVPSSGVVTAVEPILRACDGTWIAHGSGSEDAQFVDAHDRERVPPEEKRYTLRRVWLSPEEEAGYYDGFSNEGLWPLCHIAHTRPIFRSSDWLCYREVNRRFAEVLLDEMRGISHPVVFVQDYHLALVPQMIKQARPGVRVAIFWHIPWPNPEAFGICPWQSELINGMLGADVIGFHLQSHCNNFLATVDRALEARTDWEQFNILRNGHHSAVRPYPISVPWDDHATPMAQSLGNGSAAGVIEMPSQPELVRSFARNEDRNAENRTGAAGLSAVSGAGSIHRELGIEGMQLLLGVDRMDYTKGIVEKLLAVEHLLQEHPWYAEQIVFVQIASPSRLRISSYVNLAVQVKETVDRINRRFETPRWKPIILINRGCSHDEVGRFYRAADLCLVTSLHDGMNLVAKEYLAARSDGDGVLVLSQFAGAAQELKDALLVNPYDTEQVSEAIHTGLRMNRTERRLRMQRMRQQVKEHNVYRWASMIMTDICAVPIEDELREVTLDESRRNLA
jgi:trehalose 6-phosphate synthase